MELTAFGAALLNWCVRMLANLMGIAFWCGVAVLVFLAVGTSIYGAYQDCKREVSDHV